MTKHRDSLMVTDKRVKGRDRANGKVIRRQVYVDEDRREYVALKDFSKNNPDGCVYVSWFCKHVFGGRYIVTTINERYSVGFHGREGAKKNSCKKMNATV